MAETNKITVPDIGGATDVEVIEVLVKSGDRIEVDTSLITLESDKASMEIPSSKEGIVKEINVNVGDKLSEGDLILTIEDKQSASQDNKKLESKTETVSKSSKKPSAPNQSSTVKTVAIPDIGGSTDVEVIELLVKQGDFINKEQSILTLEGDKATMEVPSPASGEVVSINVSVGDKVSKGSKVLELEIESSHQEEQQETEEEPADSGDSNESNDVKEDISSESQETIVKQNTATEQTNHIPAGPAVRRIAREFGVDLSLVKGSGRKSRILKEDIQNYVKNKLNEKQLASGFAYSKAPEIDYSKFGEIETQPLNKIKKFTAKNMHRSWVTVPHVTQFDEADVTSLETFRKSEKEQAEKEGYKLTILAFVTKVVAKALRVFPQFNSSLDSAGENLVLKKYVNIGIAVDTPNGLVVPVIKDVDKLQVSDIAKEMARLSQKARDKGLSPMDMQGGCFTISSLGGIGGTAFTPIVNFPEVSILGLSRSAMKPIYDGKEFTPRLMLPLSLSYDHRVIDGAEAARFTKYITESLSDIRRVLL